MELGELKESTKLLGYFLKDIDSFCKGDYGRINRNFYKKYGEKLKFYITKSLLNDSFDELFEKSSLLLAKYVFENNFSTAKMVYAREDYELELKTHNDGDAPNKTDILRAVNPKDYCKMDKRFSSDPKLAFKLIRNSLSHFEYKIENDRIIINKEYYKENRLFSCTISISSLSGLVLNTIGFPGISCEKGAYDYMPFICSSDPQRSFFIKIQNLEHNPLSPMHFQKIYTSVPRSTLSASAIVKEIKEIIPRLPLKVNFYVKAIYPDKNIMKKAGISKISNAKEVSLYLCALDENIRIGGIYVMIIHLLRDLAYQPDNIDFSEYKPLFPMINNTVFISFMTIAFDDYFIHGFNGNLNPDLFTEKNGIKINEIPRRLRNSLAHSRYRFENIFDSSKGIIIEFWDEKNGKKTFECKITKENAEKLTNEYLNSVLSNKTGASFV